MNFSSLNYDDEPLDMFGNMINPDLVSSMNNITDESVQIRENLLNIISKRDVLPIDDPEFVDEEIDTIILKLKGFAENFDNLQKALDESLTIYNECLKETNNDINKINSSINFIKTCNKDYDTDEKVKQIIENDIYCYINDNELY